MIRIKINAKTLFTILFAFSFANMAWGEPVIPPDFGDDTITVPATLNKDPLPYIKLGKLTAKFEETTLGEILNVFGKGSMKSSGEGCGHQYWLCYSLPNQRFWLASHGEMGGDEHSLTQVYAITTTSNSQEELAACPMVQDHHLPVEFSFGWIGMNKEALVKALGKPSGVKDDRYFYLFESERWGKYRDEMVIWTTMGYVELILDGQKVISIMASHVTSN